MSRSGCRPSGRSYAAKSDKPVTAQTGAASPSSRAGPGCAEQSVPSRRLGPVHTSARDISSRERSCLATEYTKAASPRLQRRHKLVGSATQPAGFEGQAARDMRQADAAIAPTRAMGTVRTPEPSDPNNSHSRERSPWAVTGASCDCDLGLPRTSPRLGGGPAPRDPAETVGGQREDSRQDPR